MGQRRTIMDGKGNSSRGNSALNDRDGDEDHDSGIEDDSGGRQGSSRNATVPRAPQPQQPRIGNFTLTRRLGLLHLTGPNVPPPRNDVEQMVFLPPLPPPVRFSNSSVEDGTLPLDCELEIFQYTADMDEENTSGTDENSPPSANNSPSSTTEPELPSTSGGGRGPGPRQNGK